MLNHRIIALTLALFGSQAMAQSSVDYEVSITNITRAQSFTPQLVVTHPNTVSLFNSGQPPSTSLAMMAEGGDTAPLTADVDGVAWDAVTIGGLLAPGKTATTIVSGPVGRGFISVVAMMLPTNDTFVGMNRVRLPSSGAEFYMVPAYDAGSEMNDQLCASIPGPTCGGEGYNEAGGEGRVHVSSGIQQLEGGDLSPGTYDWRNPVARIKVRVLN